MKNVFTLFAVVSMAFTSIFAKDEQRAVAIIGSTSYRDAASFVSAVNNAKTDLSIKILDNFEANIVFSTRSILDLNGFTLTGTVGVDGCQLIIKDGSESKNGSIKAGSHSAIVVDNFGSIIIKGGKIHGKNALKINEGSTAEIVEGELKGKEAIDVKGEESKVVIRGGEIISDGFCLYIDNKAKAELYGGTFTTTKDGAAIFMNTADCSVSMGQGLVYHNEKLLTYSSIDKCVEYSGKVISSADAIAKYVASIDNVKFINVTSLKEELQDLKGGETVTLLNDVEFDVTFFYDATLNLNGHQLTGLVMVDGGSLTVNDGSGSNAGKIVYKGRADDAIEVLNHGSVVIEGGTFDGDYALLVSDGSSATINGGVFNGNDAVDIEGVGSTVTINGGTFTGNEVVIFVDNESNVILNGGVFSVSVEGVVFSIDANSSNVTLGKGKVYRATGHDDLKEIKADVAHSGSVVSD